MDLAQRYRHILAPEDRARLPLYAALVDELATSDAALALLDEAVTRHQNPTLILAIAHYLALEGHTTLAPLYEAVRRGEPVTPSHFARTVRDVVDHDTDLFRRELHRSTQTNEPNRSAVLAAVVADVATRAGWSTLTLIDVGCSMGLNLFPDLVRRASVDDGQDDTLVSECRSAGWTAPPVPHITRRIGIDAQPLSVQNEDDVRWLEACLWPEEPRRGRRFRAIVAAATKWPAPEFITGDAVAALATTLDTVTGPCVIMNSWVLAYLSPAQRRDYRAVIDTYRATHPDVAWITFEHPAVNGDLLFPPVETPVEWAGATAVTVTTGTAPSRHWGWCHPHGHWFSVASGPKA